jgi:superfamily II DNA/RNA helicase
MFLTTNGAPPTAALAFEIDIHMTDAFEAQGEFAPVQSTNNNEFIAAPDTVSEAPILEALDAAAPEAAAAEEARVPNGFIKLGLAPELIAAVADLGFTQPTTVQDKVIPLAMGGEAGQDGKARFVDLMVSSQTGSGKTAAFLLPVLHTLLKRQAEAEAEAKAEFQRLAAEAAARGEAVPKKPKRKDPTNARHFKAATPGALILCPTR